MDHIQTVSRTIEREPRKYRLPIVSTFFDYEKAFHSFFGVNDILSALIGQGVARRRMQEHCSAASPCIIIPIGKGVQPGDAVSHRTC